MFTKSKHRGFIGDERFSAGTFTFFLIITSRELLIY